MSDSSRPTNDVSSDTMVETHDSSDDETMTESDLDSDSEADQQHLTINDENLTKTDRKILEVYQKLAARRVDLVGDYAGNELFLIEGDSLLLQCLSDDKLDFAEGFQLLHAVYNVEKVLQGLAERKCNFNIVFFDSNQELCIPASADRANANKYLLARATIIRHLQANLPAHHPHITIKSFQSWSASDFIEELQKTPPYFLMAHDGAQSLGSGGSSMSRDATTSGHSAQSIALRKMIVFLSGRGFNVALVNELQFRDTKVMTMVLEARHRGIDVEIHAEEPSPKGREPGTETAKELEAVVGQYSSFSERQLLAVLVISRLLRSGHPQVSAPTWTQLCSDFLMHQAVSMHVPIANRRLEIESPSTDAQCLLDAVASFTASLLSSSLWAESAPRLVKTCDVADIIDGRLFFQVAGGHVEVSQAAQDEYQRMSSAVATLASANLDTDSGYKPLSEQSAAARQGSHMNSTDRTNPAVLAFSNPVFDKHLESVRLRVDKSANVQSIGSRKVFKEVSHWHNAKKPLLSKAGHAAPGEPKDKWAARRDQKFMAEMRTYAASLTNAVGKSLEPEVIIVGEAGNYTSAIPNETNAGQAARQDDGESSEKGKSGAKKGGGGKAAMKNKAKQDMLNQLASTKAKKADDAGVKLANAWQKVCKDFDAGPDPETRYRRAQVYLGNQSPAWRAAIGAECELYMMDCLVQCWKDACQNNNRAQSLHLPALIWNHAQHILQSPNLSKATIAYVKLVTDTLQLPEVGSSPQPLSERKLPFSPTLTKQSSDLSTKMSPKDFQLLHCGPYLERSFNSEPDSRVDFQPDDWQRRVLDSIDAKKSIFVVAPTSAGKTFISFYAMRKVLEADDGGVLVYVAPTKALVNQIAAEIQARYSKKFKYGGKSVWAIHTRDYRINNPNGCQVLVTVPHVLQIMLMSPSNSKSWSTRVKCIIFDEIHSIGQADDGVVWEQLLLMAPCPVIGLSATVGNPDEFSQWLASTQAAMGHDLVTVQHPHRYSDLRKYFYVPPKQFAFTGLPGKNTIGNLDLDGLPGFNYIHPVAALVDKSRGIPADLSLEPRDCYYLWQAMKKVQTTTHPVASKLDPKQALSAVPRKVDVLQWEKSLKQLLQHWLEDTSSPYDDLLTQLEGSFRPTDREPEYVTSPKTPDVTMEELGGGDDYMKSSLAMLCRLHEKDALPAILFNYDRHLCEEACKEIVNQLQTAETAQQKSGSKWQKKLERWEEWKELKAKSDAKAAKERKTQASKKKRQDDDADGDDKVSKADMLRETASAENDKWEQFDPDAPVEGYHFADHSKVQASELEIYVKQLRYRDIPTYLLDALARGVGVHHAGMNRKYRQVVEILFRKRFLRVIIATGTLAMGINMPCKTVVFSGDSVYLTALNYRQCAGRSGRRGFDLLGNVVFHGVSRQKVCRLISSRLPDLVGHFPITTSLVLRMFTLLHESGNSKFARDAINSMLSQPRIHMGGSSFKDQTMHHLRFSIEYLRRQHLLGSDGAPLNFAGLVSHLYYTENSSFAFHALLKEGYFNELCAGIVEDEKNTLETLMLVLSHLFNRVFCRRADAEFREKVVKHSSSMVFLPPLPDKAAKILQEHNEQTLAVYKTYVKTFVEQHISEEDATLPLTGTKFGSSDESAVSNLGALPPTSIRSSFVALSGAGDNFESIHDLCSTTRSGVFLEEAVIPYMQIYQQDMKVPLNAWLLDFLRHGDVITLERDNGIRQSDVWFLLNDFSLVLATIITSLSNFMKLSDIDMLDVRGGMDVYEEAKEDETAEKEDDGESTPGPDASGAQAIQKTAAAAAAVKKTKKVVKDSWDDDDEEGEDDAQPGMHGAGAAGELDDLAQELDDWNIEEGGLKNVLKAFQKLQVEFNEKFRAMWA